MNGITVQLPDRTVTIVANKPHHALTIPQCPFRFQSTAGPGAGADEDLSHDTYRVWYAGSGRVGVDPYGYSIGRHRFKSTADSPQASLAQALPLPLPRPDPILQDQRMVILIIQGRSQVFNFVGRRPKGAACRHPLMVNPSVPFQYPYGKISRGRKSGGLKLRYFYTPLGASLISKSSQFLSPQGYRRSTNLAFPWKAG